VRDDEAWERDSESIKEEKALLRLVARHWAAVSRHVQGLNGASPT